MQNPKQIFASTLKNLRYKHHFSQEKLVIQMQIRGSTITREVYKFIESGSGNIKVFDLVILKNIYRIPYSDFFVGLSPATLPRTSITMLLRHPTFTDNLALLRTSHEYTQQQLTDAMNEMGTFIHRAAYANIERGKRNLKVTDLVCLKTIYNVPYEAFFEGIKIHE